jgi:cell wall assembly regulator SMI1
MKYAFYLHQFFFLLCEYLPSYTVQSCRGSIETGYPTRIRYNLKKHDSQAPKEPKLLTLFYLTGSSANTIFKQLKLVGKTWRNIVNCTVKIPAHGLPLADQVQLSIPNNQPGPAKRHLVYG